MKKTPTRKSPAPMDVNRKSSLEQSVKNMKMIIAGLSVALIACIVYIVVSPTEPAPSRMMDRSVPAAAQQSMPAAAPQETGGTNDAPANAQQAPATGIPAPTAVPAPAPSAAPAGQQAGKINPPHGQPGHRCDIPVGNVLP